MEENINNELAINFDDETFTSIIDCEEFYFQKGREALNKWLNYELDDTIQRRLFNSIKDYNYFKNLSTDDELFELKELFFEIISYCDLHANDKEKYNKYLDKRVLAKAGVRMSPWITHLYNYKCFPDKANVTVKNALDVLKDPINSINSISITHRRLISKYYLKSEYDELTFVDGLKSCFSEIPIPKVLENHTILIANILYNQKEKWMLKPKKFKDFTESFKKYLAEENLPFQIVKEEKDWFWIADSEGNFNSEEIHYELIIEQNQINIDLHFEKSIKTAQYFRSLIDSLPAFLRWKEWGEWGNCISHAKKISIDDVDGIENAISYLNELYDYTIEFYRKDKQAMKEKVRLLKYKKQIILQGPPGTGKTRLAKEIVKVMIDKNAPENVNLTNHRQFKIVQFHPSYTYEDFVRGIATIPNENGIEYQVVDRGIAEFAQRAFEDSINNYVLIIDEINRANLSSVLGELIYALEYRGKGIEGMYSKTEADKKLVLPPNLYIIGTMNTADRSVGHIDYAIRRRFAFVDVLPTCLAGDDFDEILFNKVKALFTVDEYMTRSPFLSSEFDPKDVALGHSYFIKQYEKDAEGNDDKSKPYDFALRLEYEIKPILREYIKDGILIGIGIEQEVEALQIESKEDI
ncbi:hypothetical protein AV926_14995 [Myroides marinus]|uniref:AAA+ ATPase domain-containing protein n=1 Tax=Myroides marinus TaxID=703342 RepID=A0A165QV24_9FLAO|nr:AAA family ATPase [Myroides marinus]KZE76714.1 hypothetical protein AV926_14995 [Myroides marinus]